MRTATRSMPAPKPQRTMPPPSAQAPLPARSARQPRARAAVAAVAAERMADAVRPIVLSYYRGNVPTDQKADRTPVTAADRDAEHPANVDGCHDTRRLEGQHPVHHDRSNRVGRGLDRPGRP